MEVPAPAVAIVEIPVEVTIRDNTSMAKTQAAGAQVDREVVTPMEAP